MDGAERVLETRWLRVSWASMSLLGCSAIVAAMELWSEKIREYVNFWGKAVAETLWPTRCALCDYPGEVLCARCVRLLPYLDQWRACKRCGAPYGLVQCTECNPVKLAHLARDSLPFAWCASATMFDNDTTGRVVRVFKDQGEQRLADVMSQLMARALAPRCSADAVTFVPATLAACRHRGYDHAQLLASRLGSRLGLPVVSLLARPKTLDQRSLGRNERVQNLQGRFQALPDVVPPPRVILVDDVYTTGATLCSAADALLSCGVNAVGCLTFARA